MLARAGNTEPLPHTNDARQEDGPAPDLHPHAQALAEAALAQMKGCRVHIEGIDECAIAYLMTLTPAEMRELVGAWHHDLGFPTASRLAALKELIDRCRAPRHIRRSGSGA